MHIVFDIFLAKVRVIRLQSKVLKDLLSLANEESSNLFHSGKLFKKVGILQLGSLIWVISHQVFSQEDARVESLSNLWGNLV